MPTIRVEVCAAWPDHAVRQFLTLPAGASPADIRHHPDLLPALQEAWASAPEIAVFGEIRAAHLPLADGDRVELLRPLLADPKEARRIRAKISAKAKPRSTPARRRGTQGGGPV